MSRRSIFLFIILALLSVSCSKQETAYRDSTRPVRVMEAREQTRDVILDYTGIIVADEMKKIAFKSSGKIERILVEKGDAVGKGQVLARMDTTDLEYALEAAKAQMDGARQAYEFALDTYKRMEKLYEDGAIAGHDLDKAGLELDLRVSQLDQATADYEQKKSLMEDAVVKSDLEGYVVEVLCEEGELVSAGTPVIVVRGRDQTAVVGLSGKDLTEVVPGTRAKVTVDDVEVSGEVTCIAQVPDDNTLTYSTEIALPRDSFSLGSVARVQIILGKEKGIWVPITSVMTDGEDYVFIVRGNRAEKRKITIEDIRGTEVRLKGINPGELLVTEGMSRLGNGDEVKIVN